MEVLPFTCPSVSYYLVLSLLTKSQGLYTEVEQFTQEHLFHQIYCCGLSHVGFNFQKAVYFSSWMALLTETEEDRESCFHE